MNVKRQQLFDLCFDSIQFLARHACNEVGDDFAILVLDLRDDYSQAVVEYLRHGIKAKAVEAVRQAGNEEIPTMVAAVSRATAITILSTASSVFAKAVEKRQLPEGVFWVAIFGDRGHSVAGVPLKVERGLGP